MFKPVTEKNCQPRILEREQTTHPRQRPWEDAVRDTKGPFNGDTSRDILK